MNLAVTIAVSETEVYGHSRYLHRRNAVDQVELFRCKFLMRNRGHDLDYPGVSTTAQGETGQGRQLEAAGCGKVFGEKMTATMADRQQLAKLMKPPAML